MALKTYEIIHTYCLAPSFLNQLDRSWNRPIQSGSRSLQVFVLIKGGLVGGGGFWICNESKGVNASLDPWTLPFFLSFFMPPFLRPLLFLLLLLHHISFFSFSIPLSSLFLVLLLPASSSFFSSFSSPSSSSLFSHHPPSPSPPYYRYALCMWTITV